MLETYTLKVKNCPCCGSVASFYRELVTGSSQEMMDVVKVSCTSCNVNVEAKDYFGYQLEERKSAIQEKWNTRVNE